jgi:hypothetical protein
MNRGVSYPLTLSERRKKRERTEKYKKPAACGAGAEKMRRGGVLHSTGLLSAVCRSPVDRNPLLSLFVGKRTGSRILMSHTLKQTIFNVQAAASLQIQYNINCYKHIIALEIIKYIAPYAVSRKLF